jgi:uncharacterized membrane protein
VITDARNRYAPPVAPVADPIEQVNPDTAAILIPNGRRVSGGRGAGWIGDAWRIFWGRPGKWILNLLLPLMIFFVMGRIPLVCFASMLLWPFIASGVVTAADLQRRTNTFQPNAILAGFRKPAPLLVVGVIALLSSVLLYASYAFVIDVNAANQVVLRMHVAHATPLPPQSVLLATLLYALMTLPIFAATYMAIPLIVLHGVSAGSAVKMSLIGSFKNILPGIVYSVCASLFIFVSIIPVGLGLLVSIPVMMITTYTVYRDIYVESR